MKQHKKAGLVGGLIALIYFAFNIYHAIRIGKGFFTESFLTEIIIAIIVQIPLLAPAIVLTFKKNFLNDHNWKVWLYPAFISLGVLNVVLSKDALSAGLPMIIFVLPFCIIFTILISAKK